MKQKKTYSGFKGLVRHFPADFLAGLSVSLVALPMALGVALASNAPATSGIIAAIIGGILVSRLNSSQLSINGPASGLIIVTIMAMEKLGSFEFVLAAIIIAGIIMGILAILKLGILGDFFPASAIQGMLAAIGFIIISKQFHVMLGIDSDLGMIDCLLDYEHCLVNFHPHATLIGVISLLILFTLSRIENRYVQLIPAPMWVVVISIILVHMFDTFDTAYFSIWGQHFSIEPKKYLVQLPGSIESDFIFPKLPPINFDFIVVVISIALVTMVETVLTSKAVDKLDPYKRHSNQNKDLLAVGIGTIAAGFVGGLPPSSVISRSSVNINHGGKTSWSNFYQGLIILVCVVFAGSFIEQIPLAALAAILIYTGYKLAAPSVFRKIYNIGKDQMAIFLVTLITILATNLIIGIIAGALFTLLLQLFSGVDSKHILKFLFQSTNHLYEVDKNNYYVTVRRFLNFFNYLGLKRILDTIPQQKHVILDLSHAKLVDHTSLEHLQQYAETYNDNGGRFDIIGLDIQYQRSEHPLATRIVKKKGGPPEKAHVLTKRQEDIIDFTKSLGWSFNEEVVWSFDPKHEWHIDRENQWTINQLRDFPFFRNKEILFAKNTIEGSVDNTHYHIFDLTYQEGALMTSYEHRKTILVVSLPFSITTDFTLEKEGMFDKVLEIFPGFHDINFSEFPEFSNKFLLRGSNENTIRQLFDKDIIIFFETHSVYHIECIENKIIFFKGQRLASEHEIEVMVEFGREFVAKLQESLNKMDQ